MPGSVHQPSRRLRRDLQAWMEATKDLVEALIAEPGLMVNASDGPPPEVQARSNVLAKCGINLTHVALVYEALFVGMDVVEADALLARARTND